MSRAARLAREGALLLLVLGAPAWLAWRGVAAPQQLTLKLGPNDTDYTVDFQPRYEISDDSVTRWSSDLGGLWLPFVARGADLQIEYRLARMLPQTAVVDVLVGRRLVDRFRCRGGTWLERVVELQGYSGPLDVEFRVDSHDGRDLGLRMDWMRIEATSGRLRPRDLPALAPLLLGLGALLLLRAGGLQPAVAAGVAAVPGLAALAVAQGDPFVVTHLASKLWASALVATGVAVLVGRRHARGRWLGPIVLVGHLAKGALLFHPGFYYIDVQSHGRYVRAMAAAEGGFLARGLTSRIEVPRLVGDEAYALPYSPVFYMPFQLWAPDPGPVENALRHAGLLCAALAPVVVFALAHALAGPGAALGAAIAGTLAPVYVSRLLLAMWPALAGHVLDGLTFLAALRYLRRPDGRRLAWLACASLAALLTYITSLLVVGTFLFFVVVSSRNRWRQIGGVLAATTGLTVLLLYAEFTRTFLTQIVPALLSGAHLAAGAVVVSDEPRGLLATLGRIPIFYGWVFPALAVVGLALLFRRADPPARHVASAYALALGAMILLRGGLPALFGDLKEMLLAAPLFAVGAGLSLAALWQRGRSGMAVAALLVSLLAAGYVERSAAYFDAYQPAYMRVPAPAPSSEP